MERDCVRKEEGARHAEGGFRGTLFVTGVLLARRGRAHFALAITPPVADDC